MNVFFGIGGTLQFPYVSPESAMEMQQEAAWEKECTTL